jgi:excisionase family DNA binding protein
MVIASAAAKPAGESAAEIISVPEACRVLGVHRNTLYKLIQDGEIPAFKLVSGGRWRFRRAALIEWIDDKQGRGSR